jgi:hypothetical protein
VASRRRLSPGVPFVKMTAGLSPNYGWVHLASRSRQDLERARAAGLEPCDHSLEGVTLTDDERHQVDSLRRAARQVRDALLLLVGLQSSWWSALVSQAT